MILDGIYIEKGWTEGSVFFKAVSNNLRSLKNTLTCSRLIKVYWFSGTFATPSRFQTYCKQCSHNVLYHKTVISCMPSRRWWVGSVGWRWFVQLEHVGKSIGKDWATPVRVYRASDIMVLGPVGEIGRTDGTEWTGPVSGTID